MEGYEDEYKDDLLDEQINLYMDEYADRQMNQC